MSTNSYSALLRRSKLASYTPAIEQVYTTNSANLSRTNFGLKRPLPISTRKAPFIRVTSLDNEQRRTDWRKGTKETSFTKKWSELGGVAVATNPGYRGGATTTVDADEGLEVQSRFVPAGWSQGGSIKDVQQTKDLLSTRHSRRRAPNFLLMAPDEFERYLDSLGLRREEFRAFALGELQKTRDGEHLAPDASVDLYEHAQAQPTHLARVIERFLALPEPSPSAAPIPSPHPTLALRYSTPTALESALAPPVPGRLLGPSPSYQPSSSFSSSPRGSAFNKSQLYTSILGQIAPIGLQQTAGQSYTTFFPDASSHRSNIPGRTTFTLRPTVNAAAYASRVNLAAHRGDSAFRPSVPSYEPQVLAHKTLDLQPVVTTRRRPLPGTQAYSGSLPSSPSSSPSRRPGAGALAASLSEMMPATTSKRFGDGPRLNLYDGKRQSFEENQARKRTGRALIEERRATDGKVFKAAGERKKKGLGEGGSKGGKGDKRRDLVDQLSEILKRQDEERD